MKKLFLFVLLSLMLSSLSWAGYEFVSMKVKEGSPLDEKTNLYIGESIELKDGDFAKIFARTNSGFPDKIILSEGEIQYTYSTLYSSSFGEDYAGFVGPGRITVANTDDIETTNIHFGILRASSENDFEYRRLDMTVDNAENTVNDMSGLYHGDFVELESGDCAKFVHWGSLGSSTFLFWDGENFESFSAKTIPTVTGPGKLFNAGSSRSNDPVHIAISRSVKSGSTSLSWNGSEWEGSDNSQLAGNNKDNSSPAPDVNDIKYDQLLGWCYFTDTPWLYSYTNGSWYYMHSEPDGIYVWNANLPNNGWMKLHS